MIIFTVSHLAEMSGSETVKLILI